MSPRKPLNDRPQPGDGLPFETADQFGEWWLENLGYLRQFASKKVDIDTAEEILDAMLAEIIETFSWAQYDPLLSTAETWCTRRLIWRIDDYFRRTKHESIPSDDHDNEEGAHNTLSDSDKWLSADITVDAVETKTKRKLINKALAKLEPLQAEVIDLSYFSPEQLTQEKIARKLGLSRDQVAYLKKTALEKLKINGDLDALKPDAYEN